MKVIMGYVYFHSNERYLHKILSLSIQYERKIIILFYLLLKRHFKVLKSIPQLMTVKMSIKFNTFILLVAGGID